MERTYVPPQAFLSENTTFLRANLLVKVFFQLIQLNTVSICLKIMKIELASQLLSRCGVHVCALEFLIQSFASTIQFGF